MTYNKGKGRAIQWIRDHVSYQHDDCLKWPFSRDTHGYGQLGFEGRQRKAHRLICEMVKGPPPSPAHEAAHKCNRGAQGCVNPNHIEWKTRSENQRDRTDSYGRGAPRYKLTVADVDMIKALLSTTTNLELSKRFDVTPGHISKIRNGEVWSGWNRAPGNCHRR